MALFPQRSVEVSPELRRLFGGLPSSPSAPLSVILAHDEITPGAVLRPDNARKFVSFYFSFCEFGDVSIRYELGWFHLAVLRSSVIDKVDGGMSAALRHLLRALLMDAGSLSGGVVLPLESGPTMLFARLKNHLGDEAALSHGLSSKTASGLRPCIKCANVLKKNTQAWQLVGQDWWKSIAQTSICWSILPIVISGKATTAWWAWLGLSPKPSWRNSKWQQGFPLIVVGCWQTLICDATSNLRLP